MLQSNFVKKFDKTIPKPIESEIQFVFENNSESS